MCLWGNFEVNFHSLCLLNDFNLMNSTFVKRKKVFDEGFVRFGKICFDDVTHIVVIRMRDVLVLI